MKAPSRPGAAEFEEAADWRRRLMARLQCRSCGFDNEIDWDGRLVCPSCGSTNARVAAATTELPDDVFDAIIRGLEKAGILDPNEDDGSGEEGDR